MESKAIDPVDFRAAQHKHWDSAAVGWNDERHPWAHPSASHDQAEQPDRRARRGRPPELREAGAYTLWLSGSAGRSSDCRQCAILQKRARRGLRGRIWCGAVTRPTDRNRRNPAAPGGSRASAFAIRVLSDRMTPLATMRSSGPTSASPRAGPGRRTRHRCSCVGRLRTSVPGLASCETRGCRGQGTCIVLERVSGVVPLPLPQISEIVGQLVAGEGFRGNAFPRELAARPRAGPRRRLSRSARSAGGP
jgi:hypothetical protein